jgi:hypothetical protein
MELVWTREYCLLLLWSKSLSQLMESTMYASVVRNTLGLVQC